MHRSARPAQRLRALAALLTVIVWSMTAAASPAAADGGQIINDCVNGTMKASYSLDDYRDALGDLPADLAEYTDCEAQITAARDRQLTGSAKPATYGAGKTTTPTAPGGQVGAGYGDAAAATADGSTPAPASTTPEPKVTTQAEPSNEATSADGEFLVMPVAGPGDGGPTAGAGVGDGVPIVPVVIALSVIALTIARALVMWSRKPETFPGADPA
ncbi:MAG: hypothetical protein Q7T55_04430 [Solirubrobacteraceae bacterium]|nr:hypothetical protein [Solirubrobacteraceae bacterium]